MARKRTLNERRLTKRQVEALIGSGARPRPDLTAPLEQGLPGMRVYELDGDRLLLVFGEFSGLDGKGDIYAGGDFRRFVRWSAKVDEDARHGRHDSTSHWAYYSQLKDRLISNIDTLIAQLRSVMSRTRDELDFSCRSLDLVSEYVEGIGIERAQRELYDHLVAYVGEVLRSRIQGRWDIMGDDRQPYPYLAGAKYDPVMPINVVWGELSGHDPVNLRTGTANEVRSKRKPPGLVEDASVRAAAPRGILAALPADVYEVKKRWADGRPWMVAFKSDVEVAGIPCRGEVAFDRKGDLICGTLSREWVFGTRRFAANSAFRYYRGREDGRLNDVTLGADQEIDGLPCLGGTVVWFHPNQRVSSLHIARDLDVDGIPCTSGENLALALNFDKNGRLSSAVLAREHVLVGRTFPRGTHVSFDGRHPVSVVLQEDRDIDGIPVKAGVPGLAFHDNGSLRELRLARSHAILGQRYDAGTFLRFDRESQVVYVQP
jgi:hypothetical protein